MVIYMAETQKDKIKRLEKELAEEKKNLLKAYEAIDELYNKLMQLQTLADQEFEASPHYKQLLQKNEVLKAQNKLLEQNLKRLNQKSYEQAELLRKGGLVHNARGAGRKRKFTKQQVSEIKQLRAEGCTIAKIAKEKGCSIGLIHKLINEQNETTSVSQEKKSNE